MLNLLLFLVSPLAWFLADDATGAPDARRSDREWARYVAGRRSRA